MTIDIPKSLPSTVSPQTAPTAEPKTPAATPSSVERLVVASYQIEAEANVVVQTMNRLEQVKLELTALDQTLTGDLSTFSRVDVEEMRQQAFILEQERMSLEHPEQAAKGDAA